MPIHRITAHNYKAIGDFTANPNGKSFAVLGDSGTNKSSFIEIILESFLLKDYPADPLKLGAEEGWTEIDYVSKDGMKYTISRKFRKGNLSRFTVTDQTGGKHTLSTLIAAILGPTFVDQHFDYNKYFHKMASPAKRYEYMMSVIGGGKVVENNTAIRTKTRERGNIGTQRAAQKSLMGMLVSLDESTLEQKFHYYKEPRKAEEALAIKEEFLKVNLLDVQGKRDRLKAISEVGQEISNKENYILVLDNEIAELERQLLEKKADKAVVEKEVKALNKKYDKKEVAKLNDDLQMASENNTKVLQDAEKVYTDEIEKIMQFGIERNEFQEGIKAAREHRRLDEEYEEMTAEIERMEEENKSIFREKLPIPELSIGVDEKGEEFIQYTDVNGPRELNFDSISRGEGIKLAYSIQKALNPDGDNFIVIEEFQSLGSKGDEIMKECSEFGIQVIMEETVRDEKLRVEIKS